MNGVENAVQVDVDHFPPLLEGHAQELLEAFYPGRVHQYEDRAERFADRRYHGIDLRTVGDVNDMTELVVGGRQIEDRHPESVTAQSFRDRTANPGCTTGHHRSLHPRLPAF